MTEPITNLCIVADIYRCPPKYELVMMKFMYSTAIRDVKIVFFS